MLFFFPHKENLFCIPRRTGFRRLRAAGTCRVARLAQTHFLSGKKTGLAQKKADSIFSRPLLSTAVRSDYNQSSSSRCRCPVRFRWLSATSRAAVQKYKGSSRPMGMLAVLQDTMERQRWMDALTVPTRTAVTGGGTMPMGPYFSLEIQKAFLFRKKEKSFGPCRGTARFPARRSGRNSPVAAPQNCSL